MTPTSFSFSYTNSLQGARNVVAPRLMLVEGRKAGREEEWKGGEGGGGKKGGKETNSIKF